MPDSSFNLEPGNRSSTWGIVDLEEDHADVEATLRKQSAKHFRLRA